MKPEYREDRATQLAARLLARHGGTMNVLKLIKLMYLADRTALVKHGRPITYDSFYSLPHGPVLSLTLSRLNDQPDPDEPSYWHQYISERKDHEVRLTSDAPNDQLSDAEEAIIDAVDQKFGALDQYQLRDWCHTHLPEWRDPQGSSMPIPIRDVLAAEGFGDDEIRAVEQGLAAEALAARLAR